MKIIIATALFPPEIEYTATYVWQLAKHLKNDHQVQILAYANACEKIEGAEIFSINKKQLLFFRLFKYFIKLYQLAKKADLIYVQNSAAVTLPVLLLKRLTKKPVVLNFIEDEAWKRARHNNFTKKSWEEFLISVDIDQRIKQIFALQKEALAQADKIIFSSEALAQAVTKAYNLSAEKSSVNYLPLEKIDLPFKQSIKKNQILVFGQELELAAKNDWRFISLKDRSLSAAEISYLINTSEIIIYNIYSENFANFLPECLVAGKKIIAHNTAYAREIIGKQGVLVDFDNQEQVIQTIEKLLNQEIKTTTTDDRFSWEKHTLSLQDIFQASVKK